VALRRDEGSGGGAGGQCGVDVDHSWAMRIEADRNSSMRILDLDLPLSIQRQGTRSSPEVHSSAVFEEPGVRDRNNAEKTGCDRDRH
jgi:hypothetical protein